MTVASYTLETAALGLSAWHFHLLNIRLHVAAPSLVFWLGLRMRLGHLGTLLAMLLFGLHPVVADPVSWVTGRKDVLATCLGLLSLAPAEVQPQSGAKCQRELAQCLDTRNRRWWSAHRP